jgi:hypothetical protein
MKWHQYQPEQDPGLNPDELFGADVIAYLKRNTLPGVSLRDMSITLGSEFDREQMALAAALHNEIGYDMPRAVKVGRFFVASVLPDDDSSLLDTANFVFTSVATDRTRTLYGAIVDDMWRSHDVSKIVIKETFRGAEGGMTYKELHDTHPHLYVENIKKIGRLVVGSVKPIDGHRQRVGQDELAYLHELLQL